MLQIDNQTPFEVALAPMANEQGIDTLYLVVKASFAIHPGSGGARLEISEPQQPVLLTDEPWGEPGESSLRLAGELHLAKPATDVVLVGSAQRRDQRSAERLDVRLRVGPVEKTVRVFGDRVWKAGLLAPRIGPSRPFNALALQWENAFGGVRRNEEGEIVDGEASNPVGRGFSRRGERGHLVGTLLPNLEHPKQPIGKASDRPPPAGFGFVAPHWHPRVPFAGTYDASWQRQRAPYLPEDFDPRFFNAAPAGLTAPGFLTGGEPLELDNGWIHGPLRLRLPVCQLRASVERRGSPASPPPRLETVLLEPDEHRLTLLWRCELLCDKSLLQVSKVTFELLKLDLGQRRAA